MHLIANLEGGYRKRHQAEKSKRTIAKNLEDIERLKKLPTITEMRDGVQRGYSVLQSIALTYSEAEGALPKDVQAEANACLVGGIWLDMFGGRKLEWETMTLSHVQSMLDRGLDCLTCVEHNTSRTYGTLAKWLSPGVRCAFECYSKLPRPSGAASLLVPASPGTARVDIPSTLRAFGLHFLPSGRELPTVNIMRKFFHKTLVSISADTDTLKSVMVVLDGHSRPTIDRHYALREPEEDVALAKQLVKAVLGSTAAWPRCHSACLPAMRIPEGGDDRVGEAGAESECEDSDDDNLDRFHAVEVLWGMAKAVEVSSAPVVKRRRAVAQGVASKCGKHELTDVEKVHLLGLVLDKHDGNFKFPEPACLGQILEEAMTAGKLSLQCSHASIHGFLRMVEGTVAKNAERAPGSTKGAPGNPIDLD